MNQRFFAAGTADHPNPQVRAAAEAGKHFDRARRARDEMALMKAGAAAPKTVPEAVLRWLATVPEKTFEAYSKAIGIPLDELAKAAGRVDTPPGLPEGPDKERIEKAAGTRRSAAPPARDASGNFRCTTTPSEQRALIAARGDR